MVSVLIVARLMFVAADPPELSFSVTTVDTIAIMMTAIAP
jgi:hypothetical protein